MQPESPYHGHAQRGAPPKKSGPSGCAIALIIFGILGVLGLVVVGVIAYGIMQSEEGKAVMEMVSSAVNAPGREELEAAGCMPAAIIDLSAAKVFVDDAAQKDEEFEAVANNILIQCNPENPLSPPSCASLAEVYAKAAKPTKSFVIMVGGNSENLNCSKRYDASGEFLEDRPWEEGQVDIPSNQLPEMPAEQ